MYVFSPLFALRKRFGQKKNSLLVAPPVQNVPTPSKCKVRADVVMKRNAAVIFHF